MISYGMPNVPERELKTLSYIFIDLHTFFMRWPELTSDLPQHVRQKGNCMWRTRLLKHLTPHDFIRECKHSRDKGTPRLKLKVRQVSNGIVSIGKQCMWEPRKRYHVAGQLHKKYLWKIS